jgi:hypothetical protein
VSVSGGIFSLFMAVSPSIQSAGFIGFEIRAVVEW